MAVAKLHSYGERNSYQVNTANVEINGDLLYFSSYDIHVLRSDTASVPLILSTARLWQRRSKLTKTFKFHRLVWPQDNANASAVLASDLIRR